VPDSIAKPVLTALTQFAAKSNRLGTAGLIVLVLTALALMLTIDRTLNAIWRVPKPRPMTQRVLVYWAALTLGPLILGVSLSLTSGLLAGTSGVITALPGGVSLLLNVIEFALLALGMAGLFHFVPNTHVQWRHALAGGFFVAAGFEVAKKGLAWWVSQVPTYSVVYGALASLPIFLVWIYLGWVIILLGAVIAAYAPSLQMRVVRKAERPGHLFELALIVLQRLLHARSGSAHGMSLLDLSNGLRIDPLQIEPVVEALVKLDWVGRLEEEGAQRYVLLCDLATTRAQPLVSAMLFEPTAATQPLWRRAQIEHVTLAELLG
jgi:membrane protein